MESTGGGNAGLLMLVWGQPGPAMDTRVWSLLPRNLLHRVVERLPVTSLLDWSLVNSYWRAWLHSTPASQLAITPAAVAADRHSMLVFGADGVRRPARLPGFLRCYRLSLSFLPAGSRPMAAQGGLAVFLLVPGNPRQVAVCNLLTRRWSRLPEVMAESSRERPRVTRADLRVRSAGGSTVYRVGVDVWKRPAAEQELFASSQARELWAFDPAVCRWKEFAGVSDRADEYFFKVPGGCRGAHAGMVADAARNRVYGLGRVGMQIAVLAVENCEGQRVGKPEVLPPLRPGQDVDFHKLMLHKGKVVLVGYNMAPFWVFVWEMEFEKMAWKQVGFVNKAMCVGSSLLPAAFWAWQPDPPEERVVWDSVGVAGLGDLVCVSLVAHQLLWVLALDVVTRAWRAWDFSVYPHPPAAVASVEPKRLSLLAFTPSLTASPYLQFPRAMPVAVVVDRSLASTGHENAQSSNSQRAAAASVATLAATVHAGSTGHGSSLLVQDGRLVHMVGGPLENSKQAEWQQLIDHGQHSTVTQQQGVEVTVSSGPAAKVKAPPTKRVTRAAAASKKRKPKGPVVKSNRTSSDVGSTQAGFPVKFGAQGDHSSAAAVGAVLVDAVTLEESVAAPSSEGEAGPRSVSKKGGAGPRSISSKGEAGPSSDVSGPKTTKKRAARGRKKKTSPDRCC